MLREFRRTDGPAFLRLLQQYFPEEEAILGTDPEAFLRTVRRIFRWDTQFFLWFARAIGRPIVRFYVVEVDGRLVGMTILTFTERAGFLSNVVVDAPFRRQGFARQLLDRAHRDARAEGRTFAVLDVLTTNAAARSLYDSAGYRPLRLLWVMVREPSTGRGAGKPAGAPVRPFRRRDAPSLQRLAAELLPPTVARVLPAQRTQFQGSRVVDRALRSQSRGWVIDGKNGLDGYVRATVSEVVTAANLSAPVLGAGVDGASAASLVGEALRWIEGFGPRRVIAEVPQYNPRAEELLRAFGFTAVYGLDTLYRPLNE